MQIESGVRELAVLLHQQRNEEGRTFLTTFCSIVSQDKRVSKERASCGLQVKLRVKFNWDVLTVSTFKYYIFFPSTSTHPVISCSDYRRIKNPSANCINLGMLVHVRTSVDLRRRNEQNNVSYQLKVDVGMV